MSKRLARSDYLISLLVILLIVSCIGAFFYGLKIGKETTERKYVLANEQKEDIPAELTAYHQQYLVSFYHTIYLPYRDFQKNWFNHLNALELRSNTTDTPSVFKELDKLAKQHYNHLLHNTIPDTSPLLLEAQEHYLKSLRLFQEAIKQADYKKAQGLELITAIEDDLFFQEAKYHGLLGQSHFYEAIVKWHQSFDPDIKDGEELLAATDYAAWEQLTLNEKNSVIASLMAGEQYYETYYVHDVTLRIDELITSGQAEKMLMRDIKEVMDTLINTGAIRAGDFINSKDRYYQDELLPQLPFFYE